MDLGDKLQLLPVIVPVLILSAMLHELAHAVVADRLGDRTPRSQGRLTLNPIKHLDPYGSAAFLLTFLFFAFPFGWARAVQVYPSNFRHDQRDMALVAVAGPLTNFLIAVVVMAAVVHTDIAALGGVGPLGSYIGQAVFYTLWINVILSLFNMFPIPPLDGSRIVGALMPRRMYEDWSNLDQYAVIFFLGIFFLFQQPFMLLLGSAADHTLTLIAWLVGA